MNLLNVIEINFTSSFVYEAIAGKGQLSLYDLIRDF